MQKFLLVCYLLVFSFSSICQTISGIIIDDKNSPLTHVNILNKTNSTGTHSNQKGEFSLSANSGDEISFSYVGKKTITYIVKESDSAFILITLKEDISQLKKFEIKSNRIEKVSTIYNENILDYISIGKNTLLVLKRKKLNYQLCIEGIDTIYKTYSLENIKPKSLYVDFMDNIHLICSDSIRQIHFDSNVDFISTISKFNFNKFIKSTIYKSDSSLFVENYSSHNKKYTLLKESGIRKSIVYQSFDSARADYIDFFVGKFVNGRNINPVGDLNTSQLSMSRALFQARGFYGKILCKKLFVNTFSVGSTILVFDLFGDTLFAFKENGTKTYAKNLKAIKDLNPKGIIQDLENPKQFYSYSEKNGIYTFYRINILSGEPSQSLILKEVVFPKNIKIIDGWLFYIYPTKSGFNKLYRIKLS